MLTRRIGRCNEISAEICPARRLAMLTCTPEETPYGATTNYGQPGTLGGEESWFTVIVLWGVAL